MLQFKSQFTALEPMRLNLLILMSFISLCWFSTTVEGQHWGEYYEHQFPSVCTFTEQTNLYTFPHLDSSVYLTVPVATRLHFIDSLKEEYEGWSKVYFDQQICFVPALALAKQEVKSLQSNAICFLYGEGEEPGTSYLKRIADNRTQASIRISGGYAPTQYMELLSAAQFDSIEEFLILHQPDHMTDQLSKSIYVAWNGRQLKHFFTAWSIPSYPNLNYVHIKLPEGQEDKPNVVEYFEVKGVIKEHLHNKQLPHDPRNMDYVEYELNINKQMQWDGNKLTDL